MGIEQWASVARESERRRLRVVGAMHVIVGAVLGLGFAIASPVVPTVNASTPTLAWQNTGVTAIAVGNAHTCAIQNGVLFCWGAGTQGQLGYLPPPRPPVLPSPTDQAKAVRVSPAPSGFRNNGDVTAVSAGGANTCAIESKILYCWGSNGVGQVGNGKNAARQDLPARVSAANGFTNTNVTAVSASGSGACAIEGRVLYCWGANGLGGVGDGTTDHKSVPTRVSGGGGFTNAEITAVSRDLTTCAIRDANGGELYCWGAGGSGQLGNNTLTNGQTTPVKVSSVSGGFQNNDVDSVSSRGITLCAVRNSVMYCWGNGGYGNLGVGQQILQQKTPLKVGTGNGFNNSSVSIGVVGEASCAIEGGVVYCFGYNPKGQVGDGTTTQRLTPMKVVAGGGMKNDRSVADVKTGPNHTCALETGSVYCWGDATNGRLGNGETTGTYLTPQAAASLPGTPLIALPSQGGATVGSTTAKVTVSAGPGGVPASFTVTASAGSSVVVVTCPGAGCTATPTGYVVDFAGLTGGLTYSFTSTASSDQGTSQPSTPISMTTGAPAQPGVPTVVAGDGKLQVTVDPTTSGGTPTGYLVTAAPNGGTCTIGPPLPSPLRCDITGLTNEQQYTVTVAAYNDAGSSSPSSGVDATVGAAAQPDPPSVVVGDRSATVSVSPTTSGGTPISYTVTATASGQPTRTCTVTRPDLTCTLSPLTNGVDYTFTTTANNLVTSPPSGPVTKWVDILPIPAQPTIQIGPNGATVSVTPDPSGGTPQSFQITVSTESGAPISSDPAAGVCTPQPYPTKCVYFFPNLDQPALHTVTVAATNPIGTSTTSATFLFAQPGPPEIEVLGIGLTSVTVSVSPTTSGGPPSSYIVYLGDKSCSVTAPDTSCVITGLSGAGTYTVTASATNPLGTASNSAGIQVILGPPGAPDGAPTVVRGNGSATVTIAGVTTGGVPSQYVVTASAVGDPPDVKTCTVTAPTTSCTVTGLTNGRTYEFETAAINAFGTSSPSATTSALVDVVPIPNTPTVAVGGGGVTVSASASGGSVDSYTVYVDPGGLTCSILRPTASACFIPLSGNGIYNVTVTATNTIGTSSASPALEFQYNPPPKPARPNVVVGPGVVTISVTPNPGATADTYYEVFVAGQRKCTAGPSPILPCVISDLPGQQTYDVTVSAVNGIGPSTPSDPVVVELIAPDPPPAPLVLLESSTSATVFVGPAEGSAQPTRYTVTATSSARVTRTCTITAPAIDCLIDGMTGGAEYHFTVVASNDYGSSQAGEATSALLAAPVAPAAPQVAPGNQQATVTVLPGTGGGPASVFFVVVQPGGLTCDGDEPITAPANRCVVSGLTNGVEYTFTVLAANGVGSSTLSAGTKAIPRMPPPPPSTAPVDRVAGPDRIATSVAVSEEFGQVSAPAVYIASGAVFADALVAGSYAASDGGSVLLVERDRISPEVLAELRRLAPDEVVIVGGYEAVSLAVEQAIAAAGFTVRRVAGSDRFATATALARDDFPNGASTVYIASGLGFADALPAGVIASLDDGPVLLVRPDSIPSETAAELARLHPTRIVLVGGEQAVGSAVESALATYAPQVERVWGADRYATSVALSQRAFGPGVPVVFLASGEQFADALSAVAPAGRLGGPVLLTRSTCVPASVQAEIVRLRPERIVTLGGTAALGVAIDRLSPC